MKLWGKLMTTLIILGGLGIGGAVILPGLTKNKSSELAMAVDNLNPLVRPETVYAATTRPPRNHFIGGGGEKEYTYCLTTYNSQGAARTVTFLAQWRLKPHKYLAITTKGQNVMTWHAVAAAAVPRSVRENLAMA